ncbi:TPA: hypothetical protein ACX6S1_003501 [Photobacterium damselae]
MKNFLKIICYISFIFHGWHVYANIIINGDIRGNNVIWLDAEMNSDGSVSSSAWFPAGYLSTPPSEVFTPFIKVPSSRKIKFESTDKSFFVDSSGIGVELKLSGSFSDSTIISTAKCDQDRLLGDSLLLYSDNDCQSGHQITFKNNKAPFRFLKPIIDLKNIVNSFQNEKAPKGDYIALIPIVFGYNYIVPSSGVPSYIIFSDYLEVRIKYTPDFLTSVEINGNTELDIKYDTGNHTASGVAKFNILAKGAFSSGIKMIFTSDGNKDEFLLNDKVSRTSIPYNISCKRCTVEDPIIDGKAVNAGETYINAVGNFVTFNLYTYFKDVSVDDIESGLYKDNVLVIFEVDL